MDLINEVYDEILENYKISVGVKFVMTEYIDRAIKEYSNCIVNNNSKKGVIVSGRTGTGKTKLLETVIEVWNKYNKVDMEYLPSSKLSTVTIKSEGYNSTVDFRMPFLAIDDFGAEPEEIKYFGNSITPFIDIIQYRYDMKDKRKILFATTNLSPKMISDRYGDRVFSRLKGDNLIIKMDGEDNRKK